MIVLWFVWIKYQHTRWRHVADDLMFETYKELMAIDFDALVARAGEPHKTDVHWVGGHRVKVGWRVDRIDAHPDSIAMNDLDGAGEYGPWHLKFWINGATGMLERIDGATTIRNKHGGDSDFELKQVFAYTSPAVSRPEDYQDMD